MASRRAVIGAISTGSIGIHAGCIRHGGERVPVEISVIYGRQDSRSVEIDVEVPGGESIFTKYYEPDRGEGSESPDWSTKMRITNTFELGQEYLFTVNVGDDEFGTAHSETVVPNCAEDDTDLGGSWWVRLDSSGAVTIYDNDIC